MSRMPAAPADRRAPKGRAAVASRASERAVAQVEADALPDDALVVGTVGRPHGVRGELRVGAASGDASRLVQLRHVWLQLPGEEARAVEVETARVHGDVALVTLAGVNDRDAAAELTHATVWASRSDLPAASPGGFQADDVLGARLFDGDREVGEVVALVSSGGRDHFEVARPGGTALIPLVKDWLVELDARGRRIVMRLPEGLVEP